MPSVTDQLLNADQERRKRCNGEDNDCCTEDNPCLEGDGDCDYDNHCSGSLVCSSNSCVGHGFDANDDCCAGKSVPELLLGGLNSFYA